jgi:hypothetical protein
MEVPVEDAVVETCKGLDRFVLGNYREPARVELWGQMRCFD